MASSIPSSVASSYLTEQIDPFDSQFKNLLLCIIRWRYFKNDFLFETILPSD